MVVVVGSEAAAAYSAGGPQQWRHKRPFVGVRTLARSNNVLALRQAALAGLGVANADARRWNALRLVHDFLATELPRALGEAVAPSK